MAYLRIGCALYVSMSTVADASWSLPGLLSLSVIYLLPVLVSSRVAVGTVTYVYCTGARKNYYRSPPAVDATWLTCKVLLFGCTCLHTDGSSTM